MKLRFLAALAVATVLCIPDLGGKLSALGPPQIAQRPEPPSIATRPVPENFSFEADEVDSSRSTVEPTGWELQKGGAKPEFDVARGEHYGALKADDSTLLSSEFTLTSKAKNVSFLYRFAADSRESSPNSLNIYVLSGANYATETEVFAKVDPNSTEWTEAYIDLSRWQKQNIKLKFVRGKDSPGEIGIDAIGANLLEALQGAHQKSIRVADPVNTTTGNFTITDTDLAVGGVFSFAVSRTYNSDSSYTGAFGKGWTSALDMGITAAGEVRYPDGSLGLHTGDSLSCNSGPTQCTLTTKDQTVIVFNNTSVYFNTLTVASITNDLGNITRSGPPSESFTSTAGTFTITRGTGNRITQISHAAGTVNYTYNGSGELTQVSGPGGTVTYAYTSGKMTSGTDQLSHTRFANVYTSSGQVKKQTDGVGNITCFYYTADYETTTGCPGTSPTPSNSKNFVVDPRGNMMGYKYDEDFRTIRVKDHYDNSDVDYWYDADSNVSCVINQLGEMTAFSYDANGNMTESIDALNTDEDCELKSGGKKSTFTYTSTNKLNVATDPLGRKVDNEYSSDLLEETILKDASNNVEGRACFTYYSGTAKLKESITSTTLSNCTGNKTRFEYSGNQLTAVIDPRFSGAGTPKTTFTYNSAGQILTSTNELGHVVTNTYNSAGQVLTAKDHLNNTTTYAYDSAGRMTSMTDALGNQTTYAYDNANRLTSVTDALSGVTTYAYDGNSNLTSVTNARSKTTSYTYDQRNRVATVTDPDSHVTTFTYDAAGNLFQRTDARGLVTKYFYDAANRLTSIEHWNGGSLVDTTGYTLNAVGKRTQVVDTTGTTTYSYDDLDRLSSVTFPGSKTVSYTYNNAGFRTRITYPDSKYADYAYDAAGNLTSVTDWLGKVTSYTYNDAGALTQTTLPSSTGVTTHFTYDSADRLTKVENKQGGSTVLSSFEYTLNAVGNRTRVVTPDESNSFEYDALHRLTEACYGDCPSTDVLATDDFESQGWTGGTGWSANWTRSGDTSIEGSGDDYARLRATGVITRTVNVSGVTAATIAFNSKHGLYESTDLGKVEVSSDGTNWSTIHTVSDGLDDDTWRAYEYDITSYLSGSTLYVRFKGEMDSTDDRWGVDDIVVTETSSGGTYSTDTYSYDAVGNRTAKNGTTYNYGNSDQLTSTVTGGVTTNYGYDNNLNQTTRGASDTFTWDHENRLTATSLGTSTYAYNSDGLRVSRTSSSVTTNYVWDINRGIPVILQDGDNTYVYGLGLVSMTDGSGNQTYRMTDGLGSTVGLCDGSGTMVATYTYDAYGGIRSQTGSSSNYWLFTGEQRDPESGFDYLRARYYDSQIGRFLGQDAAAPDWKLPATLNRFSYALNSPLILVDPSGLCSVYVYELMEWVECATYQSALASASPGGCVPPDYVQYCVDADGYVYAVGAQLNPNGAAKCVSINETCYTNSGLHVSSTDANGIILGYNACFRYDVDALCIGAIVCQSSCQEITGGQARDWCLQNYCPPVTAEQYTELVAAEAVTGAASHACSSVYALGCTHFVRAVRLGIWEDILTYPYEN